MAGRISASVLQALRLVDTGKHTLSSAAEKAGVAVSSVRRAMRRRGDEPRKSGMVGRGRPGPQ